MQENQTSELLDEQSLGMSEAPSTKRSRKQAPNRDGEREDDESYGGKGWNLANFKLLTDCVSSLTEDGSFTIIKDIENNERNNYPGSTNSSIEWTVENGENGNSDDNSVSVSNEASHTSGEASITTAADDEYVCVVRTTPNYFGNSSFHKDILLFSSTADSPVRNSSPNATDNTDGSAQSGAVKIAVSETGSDNSCDSDL